MDPLSLLVQVAFYALFAITLWRYIRRRGPLELAVALVFAPLAALFVLSLVNYFAPNLTATLRPMLILILLLQPWFVVRLVDQIRPVASWVPLAVLGGALASTAALLVFPGVAIVTLLAVGEFFVVEAAAAARLMRDSQRRVGVARVRLLVAALATGLVGTGLLVSGAATAANIGAAAATVQIVTRVAFFVAAVGYLLAFVPPYALRGFAYRAMAFELT
ncbi:MAG TPA: hypothetical protein VET90_06135, partial [Candidatus Binatus sp.]|nr:hypothetical protein [Candidatus Binatus sp.]